METVKQLAGEHQWAAATERPSALAAAGLRRWSCQRSFRVNVRVLAVTNHSLRKATAACVQQCLRGSQLCFHNSQKLRIRKTC